MYLSNWKNRDAANYYGNLTKMVGQPIFKANVRNGMCFWKKGRGLFDEHILKDESVEHCVPKPHKDFFYSYVKFYVPPKKLKDVLSISGSISYDGLKKMISARCGGMGANIATLYLAMCITQGKYTISEIKRKNLYPKYITEEEMSYNDMKREMIKMKKKNHSKFKKELSDPFYRLAFKNC